MKKGMKTGAEQDAHGCSDNAEGDDNHRHGLGDGQKDDDGPIVEVDPDLECGTGRFDGALKRRDAIDDRVDHILREGA